MTEGESEVVSLPEIAAQLTALSDKTILRPLRATVDPTAPAAVVARGLAERVRLARARGADEVIILLDREQSEQCPGERAKEIERALLALVGGRLACVIKDRTFENWLLADPGSFAKQPARFPRHGRLSRIAIGCADHDANATRTINELCGRDSYDKTLDAQRILKHAEVARMALNSRSFRRFLAAIGDPAYANGSKAYAS